MGGGYFPSDSVGPETPLIRVILEEILQELRKSHKAK
jgi:hypothetical protein